MIEKLIIDGRKLDAGKLCGLAGVVKGTLDSDRRRHRAHDRSCQDAQGARLAAVRSTANVTAPKLTVDNETYSNLAMCVNDAERRQAVPRRGPARLDPTTSPQCEDAKKRGGRVRRRDRDARCSAASSPRR